MRIIIPQDPNQFEILDDEGKNITEQLHVKELSLRIANDTMPTTVQLTCYVESVDLLDTMAEVTIIR